MKKSISWEDYMVIKLNEALTGPRYRVTPELLQQMRENRKKNIEARKKILEHDNLKK